MPYKAGSLTKTWIRNFGENVYTAVLTEEQARDIFLSRECTSVLAVKYGVGRHTISHIRKGYTWKHVTSKLSIPTEPIQKCRRGKEYTSEEAKARRRLYENSPETKLLKAKLQKEWVEKNPDRKRAHNARRRARRTEQLHFDHSPLVEADLQAQALSIEKETGIRQCVDHIIPLIHGGWHHHLNLQVLPLGLNSAKRHDPFWEHPSYKSWKDVPEFLWPADLTPEYKHRLAAKGA